jgi:LmbE family N-acetylglucosaminyl deacetylase
LGLAGIHHLGFRDSGMAGSDSNQHHQALSAQPLESVAARIANFVRRLKPQVVITHDTIGGYRHPDHIMLNKATLHFWERMRDPAAFPDPDGLPDYYPQKLYYPVFNRRFFKLAARIMPLLGRDPRKFGRNQDVDLMSLIDVDFPITTVIDTQGAPAEARGRAAACHKSQLPGGPPRQGLMGLLTRLLFRSNRDTYMRVYPPAAGSDKVIETDLFAGVL